MPDDMIPRAEARAMVAAAYEAAAEAADCGCKPDKSNCVGYSESMQMCYRDGCEDIRAHAPDDARAALDRLIAEAVEAEREACARAAIEVGYLSVARAIRARGEGE